MIDTLLDFVMMIVSGLVLILLLPTIVYLCVKLGTFGYLKAKQSFEKEEKNEE